jgi:hypothetical protein
MPDQYGQLSYDQPDLPSDAELVARTLDNMGAVTFTYAAFSTAYKMIVIDQRLITPPFAAIYGHGPDGIGINDEFTLWMRDASNAVSGAWLRREGLHVPDYLAGKFHDSSQTDAFALAVLLRLIEGARGRGKADADIREWGEHFPRELPAFLQEQPDQQEVPDDQ